MLFRRASNADADADVFDPEGMAAPKTVL